jgi:hypothetical protein
MIVEGEWRACLRDLLLMACSDPNVLAEVEDDMPWADGGLRGEG